MKALIIFFSIQEMASNSGLSANNDDEHISGKHSLLPRCQSSY
jgi:hypothetical protein